MLTKSKKKTKKKRNSKKDRMTHFNISADVKLRSDSSDKY